MPFKLRLKRSRQYNVVSKSLFVICVELLDGTSIECTLSAESSGRECLDNVCQRLGLQQVMIKLVNRCTDSIDSSDTKKLYNVIKLHGGESFFRS
jgi:hypothetical protein